MRFIAANMMLASEIIKGYTIARISHRCLIKVDMMNDYDSVDWLFLRRILEELSFPHILFDGLWGALQPFRTRI